MTPEQFCYWLNGALEIMNPAALDAHELEVIKEHLALVITKVTESRTTFIPSVPYIIPDDWKKNPNTWTTTSSGTGINSNIKNEKIC